MKRKNNLLFQIIWLGTLFFISSCKSLQTGSIALDKKAKEERLDMIRHQATPFNTFSSSLRLNIKSKDKNTSVDTQLKIIKDKVLQLSLQIPFLGSEAARITISPEQIIFIDRIHKQYFAGSMETLHTIAPFDFNFYNLQALFTNQLFIAGKSAVGTDDYNSLKLIESDFYVTVSNKDRQGIYYDFVSDFTSRIIRTEIYKDKQELNLKWSYNDFAPASNRRLFPMKMEMEITAPSHPMTVNMTFSNVVIDNEFELGTTVPEKYRAITVDQLLKIIQLF